jgi:hypothetical protein
MEFEDLERPSRRLEQPNHVTADAPTKSTPQKTFETEKKPHPRHTTLGLWTHPRNMRVLDVATACMV